MKIHNVAQGSEEWHALRARHHTASEAPAMMGADPNVSRAELVRMKALGTEREFSDWEQKNILDKGHELEERARPLAEEIIGDELYPATVSDDSETILASLDGGTIEYDVLFEHKQWNEETAAAVREGICPPKHVWQCMQALLITGAKRLLFMVSDGTKEKMVWCWVKPDPEAFKQLMAGWRQFADDVKNYKHVEVAPAPVAEPITALPVLTIEIEGRVATSNFKEWAAVVTERIAAINTDLKTDQDFANAESTVKFLDEGEKRIEVVREQAQAKAVDIDQVFRALDSMKESMRAKRLELDKLVAARKLAVRGEIAEEFRAQANAHMTAMTEKIGKPYITTKLPDFAAAMKGKRTILTLRDACSTALSQFKLEVDGVAERVTANLKTIATEAAGYEFLIRDEATLVHKDPEALEAIIKNRVADHRRAEEERLERERARIRAEEQAAAEKRAREAAAAAEAERIAEEKRMLAAAELERRNREAAQAEQARQTEAAEASKSATPPAQMGSAPSTEGAGPAAAASKLEPACAWPFPAGTNRGKRQAASPEPVVVATGNIAAKPERPSDDKIIDVLSMHFRVHESKVIEWLLDMDLQAASERMAQEFAA